MPKNKMGKVHNKKNPKKGMLIKLELNDYGDYVVVSPSDNTLFERFAAGSKQAADMADHVSRKLKKIDRKYKEQTEIDAICEEVEEAAKIQVQFSKDVIRIIDGIFGEGTTRKYFRKFYEEDPDFLPTAACFTDFFDQMTPAMKQLLSMR